MGVICARYSNKQKGIRQHDISIYKMNAFKIFQMKYFSKFSLSKKQYIGKSN